MLTVALSKLMESELLNAAPFPSEGTFDFINFATASRGLAFSVSWALAISLD